MAGHAIGIGQRRLGVRIGGGRVALLGAVQNGDGDVGMPVLIGKLGIIGFHQQRQARRIGDHPGRVERLWPGLHPDVQDRSGNLEIPWVGRHDPADDAARQLVLPVLVQDVGIGELDVGVGRRGGGEPPDGLVIRRAIMGLGIDILQQPQLGHGIVGGFIGLFDHRCRFGKAVERDQDARFQRQRGQILRILRQHAIGEALRSGGVMVRQRGVALGRQADRRAWTEHQQLIGITVDRIGRGRPTDRAGTAPARPPCWSDRAGAPFHNR